mgnify:CR=1 FL=1
MYASTELPIENAVDVRRCKTWVISQQIVDGLLYFSKTCGGILELEQLLDAKELSTFEDRLVLMVDENVTIKIYGNYFIY